MISDQVIEEFIKRIDDWRGDVCVQDIYGLLCMLSCIVADDKSKDNRSFTAALIVIRHQYKMKHEEL